jgi:hypothetical protein
MKRLFLIFFVVCFLFLAGNGSAYLINDTTLVKAYHQGSPYNSDGWGDWVDIIGKHDVYNISGIDINISKTDLLFQIYTNFPQTGDLLSGLSITPADLFFSIDGDNSAYEYGVALTGNEKMAVGGLYEDLKVKTSYDYFKDKGGYLYGGRYGQTGDDWTLAPIPPVAITAGSLLSTGSVAWNDITGTDPNYRIDVRVALASLGDITSFDVIYSGSTCANDVIQGSAPVPEPATMLLLGSGLIGLTGVGRRKFFKKP